jgi:hypothetical protein
MHPPGRPVQPARTKGTGGGDLPGGRALLIAYLVPLGTSERMADRDDKARARDKAGNRRDVAAAIRDKLGDDSERKPRDKAARDRWAAAEDRRAAAQDRHDPDRQGLEESG